ncbi:MAG: hypothetical protein K0S29_394 [Gammaproteobacteria bacterium]|jgi:uncharacterized Zn-finger protein|nr:hypothetical protein [Gammaproteobacteria bacterium]
MSTSGNFSSNEKSLEQTQQSEEHVITKADLPLCCPTPEMTLWNAHPRVFLPIERTGKAVCPYCSTRYVLKG